MDRNILLKFVDFINKHDLEGITGLITDDHTFVDQLNNSYTGKENIKKSWQLYFELFPDYTIEVFDIVQGGKCMAMFGFANGTYHNMHNNERSNHFHLPSAWKVIVENDKIKLWQVYADTKTPYDIIEKNKIS